MSARASRVMNAPAAAAVVGLLAACYSLADAGNFPCAVDQTCPDGYTCKHKRCYSTSLECTGGLVQAFAPGALDGARLLGDAPEATDFCTQACGPAANGAICPTGFSCMTQTSSSFLTQNASGPQTNAVCIDCLTATDCPVGQCCATWTFDGFTAFGCQDAAVIAANNAALSTAGTGAPPIACVVNVPPILTFDAAP